jgi:hypothetical protein
MEMFFEELDKVVNDGWDIIKKGRYWQFCMDNTIPKDLYQQVMLQVYHYTRYNSVNQAACAYSADPDQTKLLAFIYKHAMEELGHERMVTRDLKAIGALPENMPAPLPPTQALIAYLNHVALRLGPIPRLGYSFWAEDAYDHIQPMLDKFRSDIGLKDDQMTFFVAHSHIDEKHSVEVRQAMMHAVKSDEDRAQILEVTRVTLYLTGQLLEESFREFEQTSLLDLAKAS